MKKKLLFSILIIMCFTLVGCNNNTTKENNTNINDNTKSNNIYKIMNASGKTFSFGEFRHL